MSGKRLEDLTMRLVINGFSALLVLSVILLAEIGPFRWLFTATVALVSAQALREYYGFVQKKGFAPALWVGILGGVAYIFAVNFPQFFLPQLALNFTFFAAFVYFALKNRSPIINLATTIFGVAYIVIPLAFFIRMITLEDAPRFEGTWWILLTIGVTKGGDIGAYFIGSSFGKMKLAPKLSPNKTFEGAFGAIVFSSVISLIICYLGKKVGGVFDNFPYSQALWLGALSGVVGQIGDLAESLLKRDAEVKDSFRLPGVGGVLDMIDSLLFTLPLLYFFLRMQYT